MSANESAPLQLVWDGVHYDCPINLTPREDGRIHSLTGCWGMDILAEQLPKMTMLGLAGLLIIAMQRRHGSVDADAILDDPDFNSKIGVHVPEAPELPPVDAASVAAVEVVDTPITSESPEDSGSLGSSPSSTSDLAISAT